MERKKISFDGGRWVRCVWVCRYGCVGMGVGMRGCVSYVVISPLSIEIARDDVVCFLVYGNPEGACIRVCGCGYCVRGHGCGWWWIIVSIHHVSLYIASKNQLSFPHRMLFVPACAYVRMCVWIPLMVNRRPPNSLHTSSPSHLKPNSLFIEWRCRE